MTGLVFSDHVSDVDSSTNQSFSSSTQFAWTVWAVILPRHWMNSDYCLSNLNKWECTGFDSVSSSSPPCLFLLHLSLVTHVCLISWHFRILSGCDFHCSLCSWHHNLLINYCQPESVYGNLVTIKSRAKFKVSFADDSVADMYNFTIAVDSNKIDVFNDELAKYLQILALI